MIADSIGRASSYHRVHSRGVPSPHHPTMSSAGVKKFKSLQRIDL